MGFYQRFRKENRAKLLQEEAAKLAEIGTQDPLALLEEPKGKV
jgi:hypothetical protein